MTDNFFGINRLHMTESLLDHVAGILQQLPDEDLYGRLPAAVSVVDLRSHDPERTRRAARSYMVFNCPELGSSE